MGGRALKAGSWVVRSKQSVVVLGGRGDEKAYGGLLGGRHMDGETIALLMYTSHMLGGWLTGVSILPGDREYRLFGITPDPLRGFWLHSCASDGLCRCCRLLRCRSGGGGGVCNARCWLCSCSAVGSWLRRGCWHGCRLRCLSGCRPCRQRCWRRVRHSVPSRHNRLGRHWQRNDGCDSLCWRGGLAQRLLPLLLTGIVHDDVPGWRCGRSSRRICVHRCHLVSRRGRCRTVCAG